MNSFGDSSKLNHIENHLRHFWRIWKLSVVRCPCWPLNTGQFSQVQYSNSGRWFPGLCCLIIQVWLHAVHGSIRNYLFAQNTFFTGYQSPFQYFTTSESPDYPMQEILRRSEPNRFFISFEQLACESIRFPQRRRARRNGCFRRLASSLSFLFFRFSEGSTREREKRATRATAREEKRETAPIARANELCVGLTT